MGSPSSSFEAFYGEHYDAVRRGLSVAFRDSLLAEDATQEAFTRAYVNWRRVARMERPGGWVYVVAVRVALRRAPRAPIVTTGVIEDAAEAVVDRESLRRALDRLPERQRLAVVLRYLADLPLLDCAAAMGCALGTVKSTLHAALAALRVELADVNEEAAHDARG